MGKKQTGTRMNGRGQRRTCHGKRKKTAQKKVEDSVKATEKVGDGD